MSELNRCRISQSALGQACWGYAQVQCKETSQKRMDQLKISPRSHRDAARAELGAAKARLADTDIRAPFAGRVGPLLPASERAEPATPGPANPGPDGPCRAG